jgi:hypothetical protein
MDRIPVRVMTGSLLNWPDGIERTPDSERERTTKFNSNYRKTKKDIESEMGMLDVEEWRMDDVSGSGGDPGVVLRWMKDGQEHAVACDHYQTKRSNARCVYLWMQETRKSDERPARTAQDSFAAAQLPSAPEHVDIVAGQKPAHEVLGVSRDASEEEVKNAFREKAKAVHSDTGGTNEAFKAVKDAKEKMLGEGQYA